ncbi:MAG TPA: Holliday junction resolvase RuvX [Anaerolineaceae bacterium]
MNGRILAVDPGLKRIGLALSDPTATFANPLQVIAHVGRAVDAAQIAQIAAEHGAALIIVGQPLDEEGLADNPQARHAARLAQAIQEQTTVPVQLWDESGSTQAAQAARRAMGVNRKKRAGHLDELAAAVILQSYLDAQRGEPGGWEPIDLA